MGLLDFDVTQDKDRFFTIEKYFRGEHRVPVETEDSIWYKTVRPDTSVLYPEYRLPNWWDRALILDYVDSTDYLYHLKYPKKEAKRAINIALFQLSIEACDTMYVQEKGQTIEKLREPTREVDVSITEDKKIDVIYNTRGNVAEWGAEPNVTYGGGWAHNTEYVLKNDVIESDSVNAWTGFRCVVQWKKWKP